MGHYLGLMWEDNSSGKNNRNGDSWLTVMTLVRNYRCSYILYASAHSSMIFIRLSQSLGLVSCRHVTRQKVIPPRSNSSSRWIESSWTQVLVMLSTGCENELLVYCPASYGFNKPWVTGPLNKMAMYLSAKNKPVCPSLHFLVQL